MKRILKREYTAEFREQAVAMVNNGRSVPEVAQELGLITQTLRNWVKAAERGRLNEKAKKVTEEQMELSRLRAENAQLKMENEILKNRPRGLPRPICIETGDSYTSGTHGQRPLAFWRCTLSPSKNLAQGNLRAHLWWHLA
jgi:transposase